MNQELENKPMELGQRMCTIHRERNIIGFTPKEMLCFTYVRNLDYDNVIVERVKKKFR